MITIFHTSSKSNDKLIKFRDNWILENPNILTYPDFNNYDAPVSDLLRNMENQDVVIFIMNPSTHRVGASSIHELKSIEKILHNIEFNYFNNVKLLSRKEQENKRNFKDMIRNLNLVRFFEDNFSDFETISNYYTSLNPFHQTSEEFTTANVFSKKRNFNLIFVRQLICYLLRTHNITYNQIAYLFELDCHASAISNVRRVENYIELYAKSNEIKIINNLQIKLGKLICK